MSEAHPRPGAPRAPGTPSTQESPALIFWPRCRRSLFGLPISRARRPGRPTGKRSASSSRRPGLKSAMTFDASRAGR